MIVYKKDMKLIKILEDFQTSAAMDAIEDYSYLVIIPAIILALGIHLNNSNDDIPALNNNPYSEMVVVPSP